MIICAFIAGALLYYALQDDIEKHLFKIKNVILKGENILKRLLSKKIL